MKGSIALFAFLSLQLIPSLAFRLCNQDLQMHCTDQQNELECLVAHVKDLRTECRSYVEGVVNCFEDMGCSDFWCLLNNTKALSQKCLNTTFFDDILQANGGSTNVTNNPCLQSVRSEANNCGGIRHPEETFACLKQQSIPQECINYIDGKDFCFGDVETLCSTDTLTAKSLVECFWEHRKEVSEDCRLSKFYDWVDEHIVQDGFHRLGLLGDELDQCLKDSQVRECGSYNVSDIKQCLTDSWDRLKDSTCADRLDKLITDHVRKEIPACVQDVADLCTGRNDTLDCLREADINTLSEDCRKYVAPVKDCLAMDHHCTNSSFLCLLNNTAQFTTECLKSDFFVELVEWTGGASTWPTHPCAANFDYYPQCNRLHPREAINCLLEQPIMVAAECVEFVASKDFCFGDILKTCTGAADNTLEKVTSCMWDNRDKLSEECLNTEYYNKLKSEVKEQLRKVVPDCVHDVNAIDCLSFDLDKIKTCLEGELDKISEDCKAEVDDWKVCEGHVSSQFEICSNKEPLKVLPCLWENRGKLKEDAEDLWTDCLSTKLFKGVSEKLSEVFPKSAILGCVSDVVQLKCPMGSFTDTLDCLVDHTNELSSTCKPFVEDVGTCVTELEGKCEDSKKVVECIWDHHETLSEKCLGTRAYNLINEVKSSTVGQLVECSVDLLELNCVNTSAISRNSVSSIVDELPQYDAEAALDCLLNNNAVLTGSCKQFLGGVDDCWNDLKNFCQDPAAQASWALQNADQAVESCVDAFAKNIDANTLMRAGFKCFTCLGAREGLIPCLRSKSGCDQLVKGADACATQVNDQACEGTTTVAQVATGLATLDSCRTSPLFSDIREGVSHVFDWFGHFELFACSEDILELGCLKSTQTRGPRQIFDCLRGTLDDANSIISNPVNHLTDKCSGVIVDLVECMGELDGKCDNTDSFPHCIWEHRSQLKQTCKTSEVFQRISEFFNLPVIDKDVAMSLTPDTEWPCSLDMKLFRCDDADTDDETTELDCLKNHRGFLSVQCHEFLLGREICLNDVASFACDVVNTAADWLQITTQGEHLCVWQNRDKVSPECSSSVFFDFFLYPRPANDNEAPGSVDTEDNTTEDPTSGPRSIEPPPPASSENNVCTEDEIMYCSQVADSSDSVAMRRCMRQNINKLNPICEKWIKGRELCYRDARVLCTKDSEADCLHKYPHYFSVGCRSSFYYQTVLTSHNGHGEHEEEEEEEGTSSSRSRSSDSSDSHSRSGSRSGSRSDSSDSRSLEFGAATIIPVAVGGIIILVLVAGIVLLACRSRRPQNQQPAPVAFVGIPALAKKTAVTGGVKEVELITPAQPVANAPVAAPVQAKGAA
eukprot:TRINITY_DN112304_c0_g1_i1.p1 TRINITY_DN112304_c0_g1~~TRINITY_DN112304_c0_g1_i1.p1  ORF type:complete len:1350 (-),score=188.70 TRINITY_DN112304_c0_g1_i1:156-4172(-)